MGLIFVLLMYVLELALNIVFAIVLPIVSILARIFFALLAVYPKFFLLLGVLGLGGFLAVGAFSQRSSISARSTTPSAISNASENTNLDPSTNTIEARVEALAPVSYPNQRVTRDINLRNGPGVSYRIVRVLSQGMIVDVLDATQVVDGGVWVKVRVEGLEGWVNRKFLN